MSAITLKKNHPTKGHRNMMGSRTEASSKMFKTKNDIPLERRKKLVALLNQHLASAIDLQLQSKQAHWNVKGPSFIGLHKLFDDVAESITEYVDMIAERVTQLGGVAEGTIRVAAERSHLHEYPLNIAGGMEHADALSTALSLFGKQARNTIDEAQQLEDADTADLFTDISREIDKWLWFVEAHLHADK